MTWYDVLLPAGATGLLIVADARLVGPYWSFAQLLPGVGSIVGELYSQESAYRPAVIRRILYGIIPGVYVGVRYDGLGAIEPAIPGVLAFGLVLWPVVFRGLPWVRGKRWLLLLYVAVALAFGALSSVGYIGMEFVQARGDLGTQVTNLIIEAVALALAIGVIRVAWGALLRLNPRPGS